MKYSDPDIIIKRISRKIESLKQKEDRAGEIAKFLKLEEKKFVKNQKNFESFLEYLKKIIFSELHELSMVIHLSSDVVYKKIDFTRKSEVQKKIKDLKFHFEILYEFLAEYYSLFVDKKDFEALAEESRRISEGMEKLIQQLEPNEAVNNADYIFAYLEKLIISARKDLKRSMTQQWELEYKLIRQKPHLFVILPRDLRKKQFPEKLREVFSILSEDKKRERLVDEDIRKYDEMLNATVDHPKIFFEELHIDLRDALFTLNKELMQNFDNSSQINVNGMNDIIKLLKKLETLLKDIENLCIKFEADLNLKKNKNIFGANAKYCNNIRKKLDIGITDLQKIFYSIGKKDLEKRISHKKFNPTEIKILLEHAFNDSLEGVDKDFHKYVEVKHEFYSRSSQAVAQHQYYSEEKGMQFR